MSEKISLDSSVANYNFLINLTTDWIKNTQTFASHYLYSLLLHVPLSVM